MHSTEAGIGGTRVVPGWTNLSAAKPQWSVQGIQGSIEVPRHWSQTPLVLQLAAVYWGITMCQPQVSQGIILVSPQWPWDHCFIVVGIEAQSEHSTCPGPCKVLSGGVRIWTQAVWLKLSTYTTLCCGKEKGSRWPNQMRLLPFSWTHQIFVFIVTSFEIVYFPHFCLWKKSSRSFQPRRVIPFVNTNIFFPKSELNFPPLKASSAEFFLFHVFPVSRHWYSLYPPQPLHRVGSVYWLDLHLWPWLLDWSINLIQQVI